MIIPKIIFIIPFRNKDNLKIHFDNNMKYIMEDYNDDEYEIYYSHQMDNRSFNRGAVKNIGFLALKNKYPDNYKNITFVFNDIDTLPYRKNILNYKTETGNIKHFYGFKFALGGIISITGEDFERLNGFPNFWGWGLEDNILQKRANFYNINIDRTNFFNFKNENILHIDNNTNKLITKRPIDHVRDKKIILNDGLLSLKNIKYNFNNEYIDIVYFEDVLLPYNNEKFIIKDIKTEGNLMKNYNPYSGILKMRPGIK